MGAVAGAGAGAGLGLALRAVIRRGGTVFQMATDLLFGLIFGLPFGMVAGCFYAMVGGGGLGWIMGLLYGMLTALVVGALGGRAHQRAIPVDPSLCFWWRRRPAGAEVDAALAEVCAGDSGARRVWGGVLGLERRRTLEEGALEELVRSGYSPWWRERFLARRTLVEAGGEIVHDLWRLAREEVPSVRLFALEILEQIAVDTSRRWAHRSDGLLCPTCLVACHPLTVVVTPEIAHTYYGCRACGQSHRFLARTGRLVATLDQTMKQDREPQAGILRVNALAAEALVDFDRVEIRRAEDQEVERFALRVANDTDPIRRERYHAMECRVSRECRLSENTWRVLRKVFGSVRHG